MLVGYVTAEIGAFCDVECDDVNTVGAKTSRGRGPQAASAACDESPPPRVVGVSEIHG